VGHFFGCPTETKRTQKSIEALLLKKNEDFLHFLFLTSMFWEFKAVPLRRKIKISSAVQDLK
jgi:hypothetical protein